MFDETEAEDNTSDATDSGSEYADVDVNVDIDIEQELNDDHESGGNNDENENENEEELNLATQINASTQEEIKKAPVDVNVNIKSFKSFQPKKKRKRYQYGEVLYYPKPIPGYYHGNVEGSRILLHPERVVSNCFFEAMEKRVCSLNLGTRFFPARNWDRYSNFFHHEIHSIDHKEEKAEAH